MPLFVNDIVPKVIVPMSFVFVVRVLPPKIRLHVPEVSGTVLQFDAVDQLLLPPPPDHVATPAGAWFIAAQATMKVANINATLRRDWVIWGLCENASSGRITTIDRNGRTDCAGPSSDCFTAAPPQVKEPDGAGTDF